MRRRLRKGVRVAEATELQIHIKFDEEAKRWYIARSDIPGLRLEADTASELIERIAAAAPELVELNSQREEAESRPALSWKPVFDSPLDLQPA